MCFACLKFFKNVLFRLEIATVLILWRQTFSFGPFFLYLKLATKHKMSIISDREQCVNPLNPKSDQNIISPYCNPAESFIKIVRIKEMIANLRSFYC